MPAAVSAARRAVEAAPDVHSLGHGIEVHWLTPYHTGGKTDERLAWPRWVSSPSGEAAILACVIGTSGRRHAWSTSLSDRPGRRGADGAEQPEPAAEPSAGARRRVRGDPGQQRTVRGVIADIGKVRRRQAAMSVPTGRRIAGQAKSRVSST